MKKYDFVIIGGGPGGIAAAKAARLRRQTVALVEGSKLGGVCVHAGCIPTKSMVISSRFLRRLQHSGDFGVTADWVQGSLVEFLTRQRQVVGKMYQQTLQEVEECGADVFNGKGRMISPNQVKVRLHTDKEEVLEGRRIILATGSRPSEWSLLKTDGQRHINSKDLLFLTEPPKHIVCVGGGYIPCTYSHILKSVGCEVTIVEQQENLIPGFDPTASAFLRRVFERDGIRVETGRAIQSVQIEDEVTRLTLEDGMEIAGDKILVATGRIPNKEGLGLEEIGVDMDPHVKVDRRMETSVPGIFAIGDLNEVSPLAHSASTQGRYAVLNALGDDVLFDRFKIPFCVSTTPEMASIGISEEQAVADGYDVVVARVPFTDVGRALAMGELDGFVKLTADRASQKLLGGLIIGGYASEMIGQIGLGLSLDLEIHDLCRSVTAHPTFCEAIQEALWALKRKL